MPEIPKVDSPVRYPPPLRPLPRCLSTKFAPTTASSTDSSANMRAKQKPNWRGQRRTTAKRSRKVRRAGRKRMYGTLTTLIKNVRYSYNSDKECTVLLQLLIFRSDFSLSDDCLRQSQTSQKFHLSPRPATFCAALIAEQSRLSGQSADDPTAKTVDGRSKTDEDWRKPNRGRGNQKIRENFSIEFLKIR